MVFASKCSRGRARPRAAWLLALAVFGLPACGGRSDEPGPVAIDGGKSGPDATIAFEQDETLALAPGADHTLTVRAEPPDQYQVSFVLLGDALDATLDRTVTVADTGGRASVELRAPSSATTFRVRASIKEGPSAEVAVSVSDEGFGTVRILPKYTGARPITEWIGSVVAHTSCAELTAGQDGALISDPTAPNDVPVIIENAPVGPTLAVTLRAGHYIWGCKDETHLVAGKGLDVAVPVLDKPLDLASTDLDLVFTYEPAEPQVYASLMASAAELLATTAFPLADTEPQTLLDEMQALLSADQATTFSSVRTSYSWDEVATVYWAGKGLALRAQLETWAAAGLPSSATMVGKLDAVDATVGQAALSLSTLGGIDAAAAGVPSTHLVTWTADPNDTVHLGGTLFWMPTRFVGAAAAIAAKQELPSVSSVAEGMIELTDCEALATLLGGFTGCDVACMTQLCGDALTARWQTGLDASADQSLVGKISFAASAAAQVDDVAAPVGFEGSWLGEASSAGQTAKVGGEASATASDPPPQ